MHCPDELPASSGAGRGRANFALPPSHITTSLQLAARRRVKLLAAFLLSYLGILAKWCSQLSSGWVTSGRQPRKSAQRRLGDLSRRCVLYGCVWVTSAAAKAKGILVLCLLVILVLELEDKKLPEASSCIKTSLLNLSQKYDSK